MPLSGRETPSQLETPGTLGKFRVDFKRVTETNGQDFQPGNGLGAIDRPLEAQLHDCRYVGMY